MGAGIAYSCLNAGYRVHLLDNDEAGLERGRTTINKLFEGGIARGKISEEKMLETVDRLTLSENYDDVSDADLVIEAVFENMAIRKRKYWRKTRCRFANKVRFSHRTHQHLTSMKSLQPLNDRKT